MTLSFSCHTAFSELVVFWMMSVAFAFAASSLSAGTACHLERLICIVGTDPGLCSPEGTHRDLDQCLFQQCSLWRHSFLMALHDEPDHL